MSEKIFANISKVSKDRETKFCELHMYKESYFSPHSQLLHSCRVTPGGRT